MRSSIHWAAETLPLSLERKLSLYRGEISTLELIAMKNSFATCVDLMRDTGRLTEAEMDDLGVSNSITGDSRQVPKDQRVLHQQRSVISPKVVKDSQVLRRKRKLTPAERVR